MFKRYTAREYRTFHKTHHPIRLITYPCRGSVVENYASSQDIYRTHAITDCYVANDRQWYRAIDRFSDW